MRQILAPVMVDGKLRVAVPHEQVVLTLVIKASPHSLALGGEAQQHHVRLKHKGTPKHQNTLL